MVRGQSLSTPGVYDVARRRIAIAPPVPELELFAGGGEAWQGAGEPPASAGVQRVFAGEAPLGRFRPWIDCEWSDGGYDLEVAGAGRFAVARDGRRIDCDGRPEGAEGFAEAVLGPALILALALRDVWCLHASAMAADGGVVAFVGESGAGKSTLARELPALGALPYRRIADDVLPVALEAGRARVLPRFPQLKCPPDAQPGLAAPPSLPLAAVYVLGPEEAEVAAEPLGSGAAALALVRHTVAARLFTPELLARHMDFCAAVAGHVPVRRLRYPRTVETLPRIEGLLRLDAIPLKEKE